MAIFLETERSSWAAWAITVGTAVDMIRGLGVTKQAASQLIDTLVLRGYLTRDVNPEDRRRMTVTLTERGRARGRCRAARESIRSTRSWPG